MNAVTELEIVSKVQIADKIVRNYALGSLVPGLIPVPLLDLAAVTGIQVKMLHELAKTYGVEFKSEASRSAITALAGSLSALSVSRVLSSVVKGIPGIGSLVGALTMPVVNGGFTYAIGKVFTQHFESGGTFLTFDPVKVRSYFEQQFEQGKAMVATTQVAEELVKDEPVAPKASKAV